MPNSLPPLPDDGKPPMDPGIKTIQPGGGPVMSIELAWGYLRRWYLKTFRKQYVDRMRATRRGQTNPCPHEVVDPRDLKYYRNQVGYEWLDDDDPFQWRETLPFARAGLAELVLMSAFWFGLAILTGVIAGTREEIDFVTIGCWLLCATGIVCGGLVVWFFRDPNRPIPDGPGEVISPADGKVVAIHEVEHMDEVGGPAIVVGIFLSIFNVHVNRSPMAGTVTRIRYEPGKFLNALRPESARENERLSITLETPGPDARRIVVRQITGAIARRIVCWLKPDDELERGERVGMIKLGSRTELVLPKEPGLEISCHLGQKVKGGADVLARYAKESSS